MPEPTSSLTMYGLILRVAREAGIAYYGFAGNEPAMIPIDAHDFDLCKQIVNDGIRMFIADAPPKGWRWMRRIMSVTLIGPRITGTTETGTDATHLYDASLTASYGTDDDLVDWYAYILSGTGEGSYAKITDYTAVGGICEVADWLDADGNAGGTDPVTGDTFCIIPGEAAGGDTSRYLLAENFGGEVDGSIHHAADTGHGGAIEWRNESLIRARQAVSVKNGYPNFAAIRPYEPTTHALSATRRWELILDSYPIAADVIKFPYTLFFNELKMAAGTATNGAAAAVSDSSLANIYPDDFYDNWKINIISGTGKGDMAIITSYIGVDGEFFVADWLYSDDTAAAVNPASGSIYYLEPRANLHPAGFRFDQAILAACMAQAEMDMEDVTAGFVQKYTQKALPKAHAIDVRSAPRKLGSMDKERYYDRRGARMNVTTGHDI